jgi:hypothetical protein
MDWQPIETAPRDGTWVLLAEFKKGKKRTISHLFVVAAWDFFDYRRPELGGRWYYGFDNQEYVRDPVYWIELPQR